MGEFLMPSLGSQMVEARLVRWLVEPGDKVQKGDIIGEIDTEKGLIDIEVFENGTIKELRAEPGEVIRVGSIMAIIDTGEVDKETSATSSGPDAVFAPGPASHLVVPGAPEDIPVDRIVTESLRRRRPKVTPLARRLARELDVDLAHIDGTGPGGSIHRVDVERRARTEGKMVPETNRESPAVSPGSDAAVERMRSAIAATMSRSNRDIPHYYLVSEVDMKASVEWVEQINRTRSVKERLFLPVLLIKAVALALGDMPRLNGYWMDGTLQISREVHLGFVVSLRSGGVIVPAIRSARSRSLDEIRADFVDVVNRARQGHLMSGEVGSATATLSYLGESGAREVFGKIYPPQVALVGVGGLHDMPRAVKGGVEIRPVLSVVLAADHRATDGYEGSRFLEVLERYLQKPEEL